MSGDADAPTCAQVMTLSDPAEPAGAVSVSVGSTPGIRKDCGGAAIADSPVVPDEPAIL